jgi:tetratricopeptide (TPR) repeat protein
MKKMIFFLFVFLFVLTGCGNKDYDKYVDLAKKAEAQQKYQDALDNLSKAAAADPANDYPQKKIDYIKSVYYQASVDNGNKSLDDKDFKAAVDSFTTALGLGVEKDQDKIDKIKINLNLAQSKIKSQEELDAYVNWLTDTNKESFTISDGWRRALEPASINAIKKEELQAKLQELLTVSSKLVTNVEGKSYELSGDLSQVHSILVDSTTSSYQSILNSINYLSNYKPKPGEPKTKTYDYTELSNVGASISGIQTNQAKFMQALNDYAKTNGLKLNIK